MDSSMNIHTQIRVVLSACLCWVMLLVPLASSARTITVEQNKSALLNISPEEDVDSFIIENIDGVNTCREAAKEEVPLTLKRPEDKGVAVENLLAAPQKPQSPSTGLTINFVAL